MIKTTLGTLVLANTPQAPGVLPPLGKFAHLDVPIIQAWRRMKAIDVIEVELKRYEAQRMVLFRKHGEEAAGQINIKPENAAAFQADMAELAVIEVELPIEPIKLSDLGDSKLSTVDMRALRFWFTE